MFGPFIDCLEARLGAHARAVSILALIWFWAGVAIQARFVPLPDMPRAIESAILWAGIAVNALWWGFLRPAIEARRSEREAAANIDHSRGVAANLD